MKIKHWIAAARLRTLPLSVSGIIMGCGLANFKVLNLSDGIINDYPKFKIDYCIFILAILTTICFQVVSNFANDYGDGVKGTDANRQGEKRLVASGIISAKQMKTAMILLAVVSLLLALLLIYVAFGNENIWWSILFLFLGILSILAAIKYTVGNNAYGYSGFGDVFVFLFFGLLSTVGSYFLYTKTIVWDVFLPAISIGLLSAAVLNLNNMRDRAEDIKHNKITLAVKLGEQGAKKYHYFLIAAALFCAICFATYNYNSPKQFLFLIAFLPLLHNIKVVAKNTIPKHLDPELKKVALSTFLFAILFII